MGVPGAPTIANFLPAGREATLIESPPNWTKHMLSGRHWLVEWSPKRDKDENSGGARNREYSAGYVRNEVRLMFAESHRRYLKPYREPMRTFLFSSTAVAYLHRPQFRFLSTRPSEPGL